MGRTSTAAGCPQSTVGTGGGKAKVSPTDECISQWRDASETLVPRADGDGEKQETLSSGRGPRAAPGPPHSGRSRALTETVPYTLGAVSS